MSSLTLHLFGPPYIELDGQPIEINKRKAVALLAYLAVTGTVHSRDRLAALLWPDYDQQRARLYLRQMLYLLTKKLQPDLFVITREAIGIAASFPLSSDVISFQKHRAQGQHYAQTGNSGAALAQWSQAVALYKDDFMAGFSLADAPTFDEWQAYEREGMHREVTALLAALTAGYQQADQLVAAIDVARRWLALDPFHEPAHRSLMQLYAQHDELGAALQQYERCASLLAEELDTLPAAETTTLYARIKSGKIAATRPAKGKSITTPQHHLPRQPAPFIGRVSELAVLAQRLAAPDCRLLTIVGPGGIGKSRLVIEASYAATAYFPHGVHFVPLATIYAPQQLPTAILQTLDIPRQDHVTAHDQLLAVLQPKQMLLVLDNYEQLLPATTLITDLLGWAPDLKLLITSRARLNLAAEWVLPLAGLAIPAAEATSDLMQHSAIRLFVQAAQQVQPAFTLTAANGPAVIQLCRLVDGNPLALTLAAGWVKMMPPALIVREVEQSLHFLHTAAEDIPQRHRSMTVVFDHSWRLLTAPEQQALPALAVFSGGFCYEAAQAVAGVNALQLTALIDKSWITTTPNGRLQLHELVRHYVAGKMQDNQQALYDAKGAAIHARHSRFFCQRLGQLAPLLKGKDQVAALQWMRVERDNIWAAWAWAVVQSRIDLLQPAAFAHWYAADTLGWIQEAIDAYEAAVTMLRAKLATHPTQTTAPAAALILALAELLAYQAILCTRYGRLGQVQQNTTEAFAHLQHLPVSPPQQHTYALVQLVLGWAQHDLTQDEAALERLSAAKTIFQAQKCPWWSGQAELMLGLVVHSLGRHTEARAHFVAASRIWQDMGEQRFRSFALGRLAELANEAGDFGSAQHYLTEVYQLRQALGDRVGLSYVLIFLGDTALAQGDQAKAQRWYNEAQQLALDLGNQHVLLDARQGLGELALARSELAQAGAAFSQAYAIALERQRPHNMIMALLGRSAVAIAQQHPAQAHRYLVEALQLTSKAHADPLTLKVCYGFAQLAHQSHEPEQAASLLTLIRRHPAGTPLLREQAAQLLAQIEREGAVMPAPSLLTADLPACLNQVVAAILQQAS